MLASHHSRRQTQRKRILLALIAVLLSQLVIVNTAAAASSKSSEEHDTDTDENGHTTDAESAAAVADAYRRRITALTKWQGNGPEPGCVCAFDFDLTLRIEKDVGDHINYDSPALEAPQVFKACQGLPCYIAMASANHNWEKIQKVSRKLYGTDIFNDEFFDSPAFQFGYHNKSVSLLAIAGYFQVPVECIILFDDHLHNKKYATAVRAEFEHVRNTTGVAMWNFNHALSYLPWKCKGGKKPQQNSRSSSNDQAAASATRLSSRSVPDKSAARPGNIPRVQEASGP